MITDTLEKQLHDVSFRYEGETAEKVGIQEKLNTAFDIAASLRKLLDEKEEIIRQMRTSRDRQESQIEHLQHQLHLNEMELEERGGIIQDLQAQFEEIKKNMQECIF